MQNKGSFLVLIHRVYKGEVIKKGGTDYIIDYLVSKGYSCLSIEHPLDSKAKRGLIRFRGKVIKEFYIYPSGPLKWVCEVFINVCYVLSREHKYKFILAVDPLSFVSAYLIRFFTDLKIHFHSVDYSESRFSSRLLNNLYNFLYRLSIVKADLVTYVSPIMGDKISSILGGKLDSRCVYFPNSPEYTKISKVNSKSKEKTRVVYTKAFISDIEIHLLVDICNLLKNKGVNIKFHLVGNVVKDSIKYLKTSGVNDHFVLYGLVEYEKNLEIISNSYIGFAWYENKISFEKYADSLKIREYAASGIPTVCNDGISTATEVASKGAGIVACCAKGVAFSLYKLINDTSLYDKMSKNSLAWARENDKRGFLNMIKNRYDKF